MNSKETVIDLQFNNLKLIQNDNVLKLGTDSVLLSSFINIHKKDVLVDLGTGTGAIPILLSGRVKAQMIGLDIQNEAVELARRNVELNNLDNINIIQGDLKDAFKLIGRKVDIVCSNPPYDKPTDGDLVKNESMKIAYYEIMCNLEDVIASANSLLSTGGRFYMVHRCSRLVECISLMTKYHLEPKELEIVVKNIKAEPRYFLIKGVKDGKPGLRIMPPLVLYNENGQYTDELKKIYHME